MLKVFGRYLSAYLSKEGRAPGASPPTNQEHLKRVLIPGDVLVVEGTSIIASAIKYLTQSTWSHAALYVGDQRDHTHGVSRPQYAFVEADLEEGVRLVSIEQFANLHCRICRPLWLSQADREHVVSQALGRIGNTYDTRNVFDLARYLLPTPPVPTSWRRKMIAFGSGDPTRAICSGLIAEAFQSVRYPILPEILSIRTELQECPDCIRETYIKEILRIRHHSLFVPRDFDVSPYFEIIKPSPAEFDYQALTWANESDLTDSSATRPRSRPIVPPGSDRPVLILRTERSKADQGRSIGPDGRRIDKNRDCSLLLPAGAGSKSLFVARHLLASISHVCQACVAIVCCFPVALSLQSLKAEIGSDEIGLENHRHLPPRRFRCADRRHGPQSDQSGGCVVRWRILRFSKGGADLRRAVHRQRAWRARRLKISTHPRIRLAVRTSP